MTIDEAILTLESYRDWLLAELVDTDREALELGLEALKRQSQLRLHFGRGWGLPLPGETMEVKHE